MAKGPEEQSHSDAFRPDAYEAAGQPYYDSIEGALPAGAPPGQVGHLFDAGEDDAGESHTPTIDEANQLFEAGLIYNFKKGYEKAISYIEKACSAYTARRHHLGVIRCLIELAWLKHCHDRRDGKTKAASLFGEAEKMMARHADLEGMNQLRARLLHYRGLVHYFARQYGTAMKLFMEAKTFCKPGDIEGARILDSLAVHYERTNDYYRAIQCELGALSIKRQLGISYEEAISCQILGRIHILREEFEKAHECLGTALQISKELGDYKRIARLKNDLIRIHIYQGNTDEALSLVGEVTAECQGQDQRIPYGMALFYKSYILFSRQRHAECRELLERDVLPIFRRFEHRKGLAMALRLAACIDHLEHRETTAIESMSEAIAIFREEGHVDELAKTYFELGKIYVTLNEKKLAVASMLEALKIAEFNDLTFLTSYIEDEIFRLDEQKWQEIVEKRARHERVFEKTGGIGEMLSSLGKHPFGKNQAEAGEPDSHAKSLISLLRVSQSMTAERDLERLLNLIKKETEAALNADRCTVFIYDRDSNELWSKVATGLDSAEEIRFPAHLGLAGYVAKTGEVLNISNAYKDPRFNPDVDKKTGYKTETILCIPMRNRKMEIMGVFQVLNKQDGAFSKSDEDLLSAIATQAGVAIENATLAKELKVSFESFVKALSSTIDARDPITAGHSDRVAEYSLLVGAEMNMPEPDLEALKYASLLHDVGKIGIKEDILKKDGRLTEKEYRHIQKHVYYTHEILRNVHFESHLRLVPEIAASHHEKVDGSGYHRGLKGNEILLSGRILAISDVFDAITSRRHYRNRMPFDRVLAILRKDAGTHFDPDCVTSFFNVRLIDVTKVLMMDRPGEDPAHDREGAALLRKLDKQITLAEYEAVLRRENLSKGELDVHTHFSKLYHRIGIELNELD